ncbi:hypothetical protein J3R30DRAFT_3554097 [Lentinula aciculospora]|uniref:Uncharacterized protein n=1 Tax=Lentinula aciculospora TaxID=153920 RepID=A0A9W9DFZ9_9AGAR|nr:hypothetical protein J3R30DRAFT_3554097 [Lentinula aciculospora]
MNMTVFTPSPFIIPYFLNSVQRSLHIFSLFDTNSNLFIQLAFMSTTILFLLLAFTSARIIFSCFLFTACYYLHLLCLHLYHQLAGVHIL